MGQKLHVAEFGNDFWDLTPKPQVAKENSREVKCLAYFTEHRALGGHRTAERPSLLRLILRFVCRPRFVRRSSADGHGCFCTRLSTGGPAFICVDPELESGRPGLRGAEPADGVLAPRGSSSRDVASPE